MKKKCLSITCGFLLMANCSVISSQRRARKGNQQIASMQSSQSPLSRQERLMLVSHNVNEKVGGFDDQSCCGMWALVIGTGVPQQQGVVIKDLEKIDSAAQKYRLEKEFDALFQRNAIFSGLVHRAAKSMSAPMLTGLNVDDALNKKKIVYFPTLSPQLNKYIEDYASSKNLLPSRDIDKSYYAALASSYGLNRHYLTDSLFPMNWRSFEISQDKNYVKVFNRENTKFIWKLKKDDNGFYAMQLVSEHEVPHCVWNEMKHSIMLADGKRFVSFDDFIIYAPCSDRPYIKAALKDVVLYCVAALKNSSGDNKALAALLRSQAFASLTVDQQALLRTKAQEAKKG